MRNNVISVPTLVRVKPGAIDRLGVYIRRGQFTRAMLVVNKDLDPGLVARVQQSADDHEVKIISRIETTDSSFEFAQEVFQQMSTSVEVIVGVGGGKALDIAKYVAFLARVPFIASPTALSNDGFCSSRSSLDFKGQRRSFPAAMPYGVVIDTQVCLNAPKILWLSGIGDLMSKLTAVYDWKLAFRMKGTQVDDLAALLSDATVFQLMAKPEYDLEGMRLLGTALMLNGIAMEICGSSRPASGSEHLISHALDTLNSRPRLHGLQVGVASYMISRLQGRGAERISAFFGAVGFWDAVKADPFVRRDWMEAFRLAPSIKPDFYTILSEKDQTDELVAIMDTDKCLSGVFV